MSILFISDIHLCNNRPHVIDGFLHFLQNQATQAQALYILGDLFEIWLGDDYQDSLYTNIANELKILNNKKIPCYFLHGNHDFLLGQKYADLCGIKLLPEIQIIKLTSKKNIMILHGDTLCTNDQQYLQLKKILNCRILQKIFLSLPIFMRIYIFNIIKFYCTQNNQHHTTKQLSINPQIIIDILIKNQSNIMIHGHTHQPAIHNICLFNQINFKRIVLGYWDQNGSMVKINDNNNNISLITFPLNST